MGKKGFTLIELLSVIVILAIVALIATPIILGIIRDSKENANKRSIDNYAKAVENAIVKYQLKEKKYPLNFDEIVEYININKNLTNIGCNISELYSNGDIYLADCQVNNEPIKGYTYGEKRIYVDSLGVNVNIPKGLTPIIHDGTNWRIASDTRKWYDYEKQEWANAVILNNNIEKSVGDILDISTEVKAMFVYVPRYSYTIKDTYGVQLYGGNTPSQSTPGAIDIKFVNTNTKENGTAKYTGNTPINWYTHPAFTFENQELEGIWVGKFELSHRGSSESTTNLTCSDENCVAGDNLRILPNVTSLRNNTVSNFFYAIRSMSKNGNGFGIAGNTHMIKNSEWAAVAYLSQSKYGKYGNNIYTGVNKEIYQNRDDFYETGKSNGIPSGYTRNTQCKYDDIIDRGNGTGSCGGGASTTGNITGIYDMSGGLNEFVMGNYNNSLSHSGFSTFPNLNYYDAHGKRGVNSKGFALEETSTSSSGNTSWYNDNSAFSDNTTYTWLYRGGDYVSGNEIGIFFFSAAPGGKDYYKTTRVVLIDTE